MNPDPTQPLPPEAEQAQHELERAISAVRTPEQAEALLQKAEADAEGTHSASKSDPAHVLAEVAQKAHGEADETAPFNRAVEQATSGQRTEPSPPRTSRGLDLLRRALFKRLGPLPALDLYAYLAVNHLPHPRAADRCLSRLSWAMTGGFGWLPLLLLSLAGAGRKRPPFWRTVAEIVVPLWLATSTVEHPVKTLFRRRRPFIDSVQAIVVGRKPGSYSFPSGHSAAAFAGAVLLARRFPRWRRVYYFVAALTGFSRTYLGAHYPGDVVSGSLSGAVLARAYQALVRRAIGR